jgi:hypothetical protein
VVNGVGLATLSMRVDECLSKIFDYYPPGRATVRVNLTADLETAMALCDRALLCLPEDPRPYFEELRSVLHDALATLGKLSWTDRRS